MSLGLSFYTVWYFVNEFLLSFHFTKEKILFMFFMQQPSARIAGAGPSAERTDKASGMYPYTPSPSQITCCFGFSRYIHFVVHLDIYLV
jgi:hypothetical protein